MLVIPPPSCVTTADPFPRNILTCRNTFDPLFSLLDVVNYNNKLYLVFEFLDQDLKRYIDTMLEAKNPIAPLLIKVRIFRLSKVNVICLMLSFRSTELHVAAFEGNRFLPLPSRSAPRLEASELAY